MQSAITWVVIEILRGGLYNDDQHA
jgi:hypothetical protein